MYKLWFQPGSFLHHRDVNPKHLLGYNLILLFFSSLFLGLIMVRMMDIEEISKTVTFLVLATVLVIPFFYILNFIYTIIVALICLIFRVEIVLLKAYSIIISVNSFLFMFSALLICLQVTFHYPIVIFGSLVGSWIISFMAVRVFYYGLHQYVGLNKGFCLFFCGIVAVVAVITNSIGVISYVS
ncbi:hypothetical protein ABU162_14135 [Paenibacillus thiaminolyticus]|uniref:hypothetical protein n=1 Tax=Paenibacillus thiaminolyticus TaxID=49283 RepID=UPI0035A6B01C